MLSFESELRRIIPDTRYKKDEPMKNHTTFRVGGPADYVIYPDGINEIKDILMLCYKWGIKSYIMGNGSNLLVSDEGYKGVILKLGNEFSCCRANEGLFIAQAGMRLSNLASLACTHGYTGIEFLYGIPGTVGGAVVMNAGAYGGEIKDVVKWTKVLDNKGNLLLLDNSHLKFGYRKSLFTETDYIVLEAAFELSPGNKNQIKNKMDELMEKRKSKQPLEYPSAGSTFKRPEGYFAGQLIEESGLKGYSLGGAQISEKHCGFIINKGNATADDIKKLIAYVQREVKAKKGITLEPEIKII
ncbi:MAG: UDP-N-acetylmuramate dehydrogenase [Eubacterium sp.]